jgi:outer membrane protease
MSKRLAAFAVLLLLSLPAFSAPEKSAAPKAITWDLWGGDERMSGHVTYQIGEEGVYFPLSELKWPADVTFGSVGGSANYGKWEASAVFSKNIDSDAGTMEDSDWLDDMNPDLKTVYSESDTDFDGYTMDGSVRYWMMNTAMRDLPGTSVALAAGLGYLYQNFSWDAKNLDQWYPQNPEYGHDLVPGTVGSYESTLNMPYIEAAGKLAFKGLTLEGSLGFAPYVQVDDVDDHKLRYIYATTDADGTAFKASLQARYNFTKNLFMMAQVNYLTFDVEGTEKDITYAGPEQGEAWTIDHKIKSDQTSALLAAGVNF